MPNPTNLSDEEYEQVLTRAYETHRSQIDAVHGHHQRIALALNEVIPAMADTGLDQRSIQNVINALLKRLERTMISTFVYEPALQVAQAEAALVQPVCTTSAVLNDIELPKQVRHPFGFQAQKK